MGPTAQTHRESYFYSCFCFEIGSHGVQLGSSSPYSPGWPRTCGAASQASSSCAPQSPGPVAPSFLQTLTAQEWECWVRCPELAHGGATPGSLLPHSALSPGHFTPGAAISGPRDTRTVSALSRASPHSCALCCPRLSPPMPSQIAPVWDPPMCGCFLGTLNSSVVGAEAACAGGRGLH